MTRILDDRSLDSLFRAARTCRAWLDKPVSDAIIEAVWELARLPPTSTGTYPARILFIRSLEAKQELLPALAAEDRAGAAAAPVNAILGYDGAGGATALRDATLQAGYLILAARAIGLDCAPIAIADPARVERKFFGGGAKGSFVCNLGYGDPGAAKDLTQRPTFEQACRIV